MRPWFLLTFVGVVLLSGILAWAQDNSTQSIPAAQASEAAVPRLVRFSGMLKDAAGKASRGVQDVTFSLYATESGGEALWFETQTVEVDAQGRYTVLLGAMHPDGLPMELFTSGEARWLGVSVGKLPEQARVLLVSVPYALKAADSESLGGKPAAAYALQGQARASVLGVGATETAAPTKGAALTSNTQSQPSAVVSAGQTHFIGTTSDYMVRVTQSGTGRGLYGLSQSGEAVWGQILSTSGTTYGVRGLTPSTTGAGVYGQSTATTGPSYGVRGQTLNPVGGGVFGYNQATTGLAYGVIGQTKSAEGIGVFGRALATTGITAGVAGYADSTNGIGVLGEVTLDTGTPTGVRAKVHSPTGVALVADNSGGGKIFSARHDNAEKFAISGNGNVGVGSSYQSGLQLYVIRSAATYTAAFMGGNVGIGTTTPARELEVNGGIRLNTSIARPACAAATRGTFWMTQSAAGKDDQVDVCIKSSTGTYVWKKVTLL